MVETLYIIYLISILLSAVMAILNRKYLASRKLSILVPFLIYIFLQETILSLNNFFGYFHSNAVIYNIYRPISAMVFAFIYFSIPFMSPLKKLIAGLTIIYLLLTVINYCFIESIFTASSYFTLARGIVITFFAILFLFRYFNLDNIAEEKYWRPLIWVTAGIALFYPVTSISLTFQKYLANEQATFYGLRLYQLIPQVMSIFMYNCFSYAFYLCRKIK
jgi:hypothetical protein